MIRFLFIVSNYPPRQMGGMELSTQRLANALVRAGHQVKIVTQHCTGRPPVANESGVQVYRTIKPWNLGPLWGFTYIAKAGMKLKELRDEWDFCICRGIYLHCSPAVMICENLGRPCATMPAASGAHGDIAQTRASRFGDLAITKALHSDGHFVLSREIGAELRNHDVPEERLHPFRNIVDLRTFFPVGSHDRNLFLYVGRFDEQKNLPLLINAFAALHHEHPEAKLLLIGSGPEEQRLRALVAAGSASRAISLQPWTDQLAPYYRNARAFVLPSRGEGLSNAMLEAMACGTPVITTDVSGARETLGIEPQQDFEEGLIEGRGGILADGGESSLTDAMLLLLKDAALRDAMSTDATEYVRTHHGEEQCVKLFLEGCRKIIAQKTGADP